ncbi:MAG: cell wall-binding repeat-containing protein, partial [Actinomycetota bacterium]|nr:cell wall-binding repeat-containing protein [Actinomycetota bacterium]
MPSITPPIARRRLLAVAAHRRLFTSVLAGLLTLTLVAAPSVALTPAEHEASSSAAAQWIVRQVNDDGSVDQGFSAPPGNAVQAALALAAAEEGGGAFDRALEFVKDTWVDSDFVVDGNGDDYPAALALIILLADAAGENPRQFGGTGLQYDAVRRLEDTLGDREAGLYGAQPPTHDGVFRQSLAILALRAAGQTPVPQAIEWLQDQQCASGGFPAYRPPGQRGNDGCPQSTPDSNSTALATQAFAALPAAEPPHDPLQWLEANQQPDGGWNFSPAFGGPSDANSTGLVVQALVASDQDPEGRRWTQHDMDGPFTALRALQIGCEAGAAERGAFAFTPDEDGGLTPNGPATYQAVPGVEHLPYPFGTRQVADGVTAPRCPRLVVDRDGGRERIETSAIIARDAFPDGADTVVIAFAYGHADALVGAPLARKHDAPILLSKRDGLPDVIAKTVNDLGATRAILVGGTAVLSPLVREDLLSKTTVKNVGRVAGPTRFHTAKEVADRIGGDTAYVAEGHDPDPARGW